MQRFNTLLFVFLLNGVLCQEPGPSQYSLSSGLPWIPVNPFGFWTWRSARFAAKEILNIPPGIPINLQVTSAWAVFWNTSENRYNLYYVYFHVRFKTFPFSRYFCRAWVHWPPPSDVHLDGSPLNVYNNCVPM